MQERWLRLCINCYLIWYPHPQPMVAGLPIESGGQVRRYYPNCYCVCGEDMKSVPEGKMCNECKHYVG